MIIRIELRSNFELTNNNPALGINTRCFITLILLSNT